MLEITIPASESFDEKTSEFVVVEEATLRLEHSLVSLSKWESKWEKPFLGSTARTDEEVLDYIKCMSIDDDFPPEVLHNLSQSNIQQINEYISAKMSATWFSEKPGPKSRDVITSELIYYWMVALNIPFECEHWHLSRLFTLIKVINEKNAPAKKMSTQEILARNRQINEERKAQLKSKG